MIVFFFPNTYCGVQNQKKKKKKSNTIAIRNFCFLFKTVKNWWRKYRPTPNFFFELVWTGSVQKDRFVTRLALCTSKGSLLMFSTFLFWWASFTELRKRPPLEIYLGWIVALEWRKEQIKREGPTKGRRRGKREERGVGKF